MTTTEKRQSSADKERVLIMGAGGRDFHVFNCLYRNNDKAEVVCFTAAQIPGIDKRRYPPELAGHLYPQGIQVYPEEQLEELVARLRVDRCVVAYSDLSEHDVMELESRVLAAGAAVELPNPFTCFLRSKRPVVAVTAVRTGAGKSQVSHYVGAVLTDHGLKTVLVRHPMPYGNLKEQRVQRFETYEDLKKHKVTIEEREEYEQHLKMGVIVYAGVDYHAILEEAEKESDVIIWDGGNNDTPFFNPDLWICIADPLRVGHEVTYYPGNVNFRSAAVIVINKANSAPQEDVAELERRAKERNPKAQVVVTDSVVTVDDKELIRGKRVVTVDDGPTITHGGMPYGAGKVAAEESGAEVVDPRHCFSGSLGGVLKKYRHIGKTIPAMGYSAEQIEDLAATINCVDADAVVIATPMDLSRLFKISKPSTLVRYAVADRKGEGSLRANLESFLKSDAIQKQLQAAKIK